MKPSILSPRTAEASPEDPACRGTAFGCPRDFLENRFVYTVISSRARGLSVGINMNPDKRCNFDCIYCEVNRDPPEPESCLDVPAMLRELRQTLRWVRSGALTERPTYRDVPLELMELRHVALAGDGEPTLCPCFVEGVEALVHLRAEGSFPFFKIVLITNGSRLDRPDVMKGLSMFTSRDEIWVKLEAGTQDYMDRVNRPDCTLESTLANTLRLGRERPVIIQSLFPSIDGAGPSAEEVEAYVRRLLELKQAGAKLPLVQIHSATRPPCRPGCGHLPLKTLASIAQRVREVTGLTVEVF